jgi:glycosyltransferase involved in cell wall biosynthesis
MTTFSVVIATRNRARLLQLTLRALLAQTWPRDRIEIIVADNNSSDETAAMVAAVAREAEVVVRYVFVEPLGKSHAINQAVALATGDVIAYTDDDVQPDPSWLSQLALAFDETGADFVAGRILPTWEAPKPEWLLPELFGVIAVPDNGCRRESIDRFACNGPMPLGANMAVSRRVVSQLGGLREDLGKLDGTLQGAEDHEYFLRMVHAGFTGIYEPSATVRHWVPASRLTRDYFRRWLYRNGRDTARVEHAFPSRAVQLGGVPRYLWRQAALNLWAGLVALASGDSPRRSCAVMRFLWFCGYVRERWTQPMLRVSS